MSELARYSQGELRAMADCRAISSARYVEEVERRRSARILIEEVPPLDYALEDELARSDLDLAILADDEGEPAPPALMWIISIAAALFLTALWMVL